MGIVFIGAEEVLCPTKLIGTRGTRGSDDAGSGLVAVGTVDAVMWGSSVGVASGG